MVVALVVAACGASAESDGESDTDQAPTANNAPAATDAPAATEAPPEDTEPSVAVPTEAEGAGIATVTVDGETYHFGDTGFPGVQCMPGFFGVMLGALRMTDEDGNAVDSGGTVSFALLREGTDPDVVDQTDEVVVKVKTGDEDREWIADQGRYEDREALPGTSEVTSVTYDGDTATGTASAYDDESYWGHVGDPESVPTASIEFEITCFDE